ncbi:MAG: DinB family protein, partial [Brevefilum sp.]
MHLSQAVNQMHYQGKAILSLCAPVSEEQARWKPDPENWSILEVLNHLLIEERLDFRSHLGYIFQ